MCAGCEFGYMLQMNMIKNTKPLFTTETQRTQSFSMLFKCGKALYKHRTASNEYAVIDNIIYLEPITASTMGQQACLFPRPSPLVPRPCI
jgi:hypothetical protein